MCSKTLPPIFWYIFYLLLISTMIGAIVAIANKRVVILSILAIPLSFAIPIVGFMNSITRGEKYNELQYLIVCLKHGSLWAVFMVIAILVIIIWWILFIYKSIKK